MRLGQVPVERGLRDVEHGAHPVRRQPALHHVIHGGLDHVGAVLPLQLVGVERFTVVAAAAAAAAAAAPSADVGAGGGGSLWRRPVLLREGRFSVPSPSIVS